MDVLSTTSFKGCREGDETMLPLRVESVGSNSVRGPTWGTWKNLGDLEKPGGPGDFTPGSHGKMMKNIR